MSAFLRKSVDGLVTLSAVLGAVALVVVAAVVMINVVGRAFGQPLYGAQDIVQMAAIFVVFGGMAYTERRGGHISVDLLERRFPPGLNRWLTLFGRLLGALVFALIAWRMWEASKLSVMLNMSTNLLNLPRAHYQLALAGLSAVASIGLLVRALVPGRRA